MRLWRNRQTRTFEGRMGDRMGSSPINRTIKETSFVYQGKRGFFIAFWAKYRGNIEKSGSEAADRLLRTEWAAQYFFQ